ENAATPIAIRRAIPAVLLRIGTSLAEAVLIENLLDGDTELRFRILTALNKLRSKSPRSGIDLTLIETVLAAEIMGHLRSYQILGTLPPELARGGAGMEGLRQSMAQELERIFRLLKLLYPSIEFHSAYFGVQSGNRKVHDDALEYLENVLTPSIRKLLIPLLDHDVTLEQRIELANRELGTNVETGEQAVDLLARSSDPYLKACAAHAIGVLGLTDLADELDRWAADANPVLSEAAKRARERLRRPRTGLVQA
ncbi:MAG TPA: hypothetical protein VNK41_05315, partial [Vicinamibacterales bacterium]|nr:hypothetical protein [Vicinamibacterales bacterium]